MNWRQHWFDFPAVTAWWKFRRKLKWTGKEIYLHNESLQPRLKNVWPSNWKACAFASGRHWQSISLLKSHSVAVAPSAWLLFYVFLLVVSSDTNHRLVQKSYSHFCASYRFSREYDAVVQWYLCRLGQGSGWGFLSIPATELCTAWLSVGILVKHFRRGFNYTIQVAL